MSGYNTIRKIQDLEERITKMGMRWGHSNVGNYMNQFGDILAVMPAEQHLPVYSRDAEIFVGTLEELECWLKGIEWARIYDGMLFGKNHDRNRQRREQDFLNEQLIFILKNSEDKK